MTLIRITAPNVDQAKAQLNPDGSLSLTFPDPQPQAVPVVEASTTPEPMRIGYHPKPAEYGIWFTKLPAPWFTRVFIPDGSGLKLWGGPAITGLPTGTIPHISFKDRVSPATITAFLDSIPQDRKVWLTWHHEGDIDWALASDVDGYVNYWKLLRQTVDAHPSRPRVTLINVHTQYASRNKRQLMQWRRFMLPDIADVDSWDCYRPSQPDSYEVPEVTLALALAARREFGVRTHITEFGTHPITGTWDTDGTWQATWYRDGCAYAQQEGVEAIGFWCNTDGYHEYRPTKAKVLTEWKSLIATYNAVPAR